MNKKYFFIGSGVIILALLGFLGYRNIFPQSETVPASAGQAATPKPQEMVIKTDPNSDPKSIGIKEYITANISNFSPLKEGQGRTFTIKSITVTQDSGVVSYTDGNASYTADFKYNIDPVYKNWTITSFVIRK